ncbi:hypothetical protein ANCDUO_20285 [Ancylostoma duodenale]|uniref:Uncharacterized protein n=1 Tax=Ancylostoma duodenale TaxID=51022 RepID=A0A0C2FSK0_9BILA|nr:hypothetical protein ANCDUO_20285 [Ancylostoma duodenale]
MPEPIAAEPQLYTPLYELGQLLASYGYVPRATFRPGATVVHVQDEARQRMNRHGQPQQQRNSHSGRSNRTYSSGANGYPMHPNGTIPSHSSAGINGIVPSTSQYGGMERRSYRDQNSRGGRGSATGGGPRRGNGERTYHQGGRRNGGANGSNHDGRRRSDYCNGGGGGGTNSGGTALSVSTGNLASAASAGSSNTLQIERYVT